MVERDGIDVQDQPPDAPVFECPECHEKLPTAELLGDHIERHRPVQPPVVTKRGKVKSRPCPKGCGRNFLTGNAETNPDAIPAAEMRAHIESCDGSAPLPVVGPKADEIREEAVVAKKEKCETCGEMISSHPPARAKHLRKHGVEIPKGRRAKTVREEKGYESSEPLVVPDGNGQLTVKEKILNQLELEEERLSTELGQVKAMISAVRDSGGGGVKSRSCESAGRITTAA